MKELDINNTDIIVIDGDIYGLGDESARQVGLEKGYIKEHKIIQKEIIQFVNTKHRNYYGFIDLTQMPQIGKFITLTTMFGEQIKINIDTINEVKDIQAILVRWDVTGYDNIWKEIRHSKWAYKYVWYHFGLNDNVIIANRGDNIQATLRSSDRDNLAIASVLDYEGKDQIQPK